MNDPMFTAEDALNTTRALRKKLGLAAEQFPASAFVGMISDEIEQLRAHGHEDVGIAEMVAEATGKPMTADLIKQHYASAAERGQR